MDFERMELGVKPMIITRKADKQGRIVLPAGWQNRSYILYTVELPEQLRTARVKHGLLLVPTEE